MSSPVSPVSPVLRLPIELLGEIFTICSQPSTSIQSKHCCSSIEVDPHTQFHSKSSPLNLTHVNRHWRDVALSMPLLWSTLLLRGGLDYHPSLVELWLQRSGACPLTLSIHTVMFCQGIVLEDFTEAFDWKSTKEESPSVCNCHFQCPIHNNAKVQKILSLMVEHASRWREIAFDTCLHHPTALLHLQKGQLSALEKAEFSQSDSFLSLLSPEQIAWVDKNSKAFWLATHTAPLLRSVALTEPITTDAPWPQLTDITLNYAPHLSMLSQCVSLEKLTLYGYQTPPLPTPILLPKLHTLEITAFADNCRLDSFNLPSLKTLDLSVSGLHGALPVLEKCFSRSSTQLTSLTIHMCCDWTSPEIEGGPLDPQSGFTDSDWTVTEDPRILTQFLSTNSASTITSFTMMDTPVPPLLLTVLASSNSTLLPNVQAVTLGCSRQTMDADLVKFATLRRSTMNSLRVVFHKTFEGDRCVFDCRDIPELSKLARNGLDVVIQSSL